MIPNKIAWYSFSIKDVLEKLQTSPQGLSSKEAFFRLKKYGPNQLREEKKKSEFYFFLKQFKNPLVYLLFFAALISYFLRHNIDTIIILFIVFFNAFVGYLQEKKAVESLKALKKLMALRCKVLRDDEKMEISALELVVGDIVILEEGNKIPADLRILDSLNLRIDESTLTGESVPVHKRNVLVKAGSQIIEQKNMVFASTIVTSGKGLAIAVATGKDTELAQIAKETISITDEITPLGVKLKKFSNWLLIITLIVSAIIFILGIINGFDLINMFLTASAAAVSLIPEGLPAIITITLAIGVHRMAKRNAIVRELEAIETLGSISLIASDKTGTLTYNQMTVEKIYLDGELIKISGSGYNPKGCFYKNDKIIKPLNNPSLKMNLLIGTLCNNASLVEEEKNWKITGDPTEGSLIVAGDKADLHQEEINKKYTKIDEIPFESKNRFMATLHQCKKNEKTLLAVKGTIEKILESSQFIYKNGKIRQLNIQEKKNILEKAHEQANNAYRIIAMAFKYDKKTKEKITEKDICKLIFSGFDCLEDSPRPEAREAVIRCQDAGIRVVMVTGDFSSTALAVAKKLNIASQNSNVITGEELLKMDKNDFQEILKHTSVFARVTPELKLKIVQGLQAQNNITAVTGDGVNDAPILKKADVGVAMGQGGTDVARESSDIILLNNNFTTIVNAIEEGRAIFLNIRRAIFFLLSTNAGEATILMSALILSLPLPLTAIQILWINLITDGISGFALTMEPKHEQIMKQKPRPKTEGILNNIVLMRIILVAIVMTVGTIVIFKWQIGMGASTEKARTVAFVTMAFFQIFNIFNARSIKNSIFELKPFSNFYVVISVFLMIILTIFTSQLSIFQELFQTVSLTASEYILIILVSLTVVLAVEIEKFIRKISNP
ncbi:hypothetical protein A3F08_01610 [Candidatus Berkelbacteria bacterium RIFCSPHIGHO2_12_FULL_36_9]|uniref:Cation-transporting P-type ATPase N-terminal domain-containing protein n=1 Tax=Candidatus Berkelbacteria bacterium RIFCSPHIGHO2_12_FULL_36_9 TaxID=1797469 RepID=A0A1F5EKC0_9BACT|nr:MAG: hypothetical protein A3F08_01610 [Candidatus Berkelbacteria bacterium RIFCSPHIGHO2_12_FULL_36_9]